jgi:hypothetical protein
MTGKERELEVAKQGDSSPEKLVASNISLFYLIECGLLRQSFQKNLHASVLPICLTELEVAKQGDSSPEKLVLPPERDKRDKCD